MAFVVLLSKKDLNSFEINGGRHVPSPLGMSVNKLVAQGEMVYADYTTTNTIRSIVSHYDINILDTYVGGYLLSTASAILENQGLMEVSTERINFAVNIEGEVKQFSIDFGFRKHLVQLLCKSLG